MSLEIADLHSHFPMHFTAPERYKGPDESVLEIIADNITDTCHELLLRLARRLLNNPSPRHDHVVTLDAYKRGDVGLAFSVLYSPLDEFTLSSLLMRKPPRHAFDALMQQLIQVELDVGRHSRIAMIARNQADLDRARAENKVAIVHCVEGGFHLGRTPKEIERHVEQLRHFGVTYVTVAHLFYRRMATNTPAFPFLSDAIYHCLHPQPASGLTRLGRAAVRAMCKHRLLIDVTHMSETAMLDTFELMDRVDPDRSLPVVASHMACRFGTLEYNLDDRAIRAIQQRDGVMGVIMCEHYASDGLDVAPASADESFDVICQHIDRVHAVTGNFDHIAIGSDHDGFIKPALRGFERPQQLRDLSERLLQRYGQADAEKICSANIRRVLSQIW